MKKFLLLFAALLAFYSATAQEGAFGVKAGINYSGAFASESDIDPKSGFVGGIYGLFEGRRIGLQAELLYSRQGFKDKTEDGYTRNYMLNYLEIPLIVKIFPFRWISIDAGYQTAILLDTGREKIKRGASSNIKSDLEGMRSVNNSVVLGLSFRLGPKIDLSARYLLGISDLLNKEEGDMLRSRAGQFTLGYRF